MNKNLPLKSLLIICCITTFTFVIRSQNASTNDVTAQQHDLQSKYSTPYGLPTIGEVTTVLEKVYKYLDEVTPAKLMDDKTKKELAGVEGLTQNSVFASGSFEIISYEWGVTYAGMLLATEATGDKKFTEYTNKRLKLIADVAPFFKEQLKKDDQNACPVRSVLKPHSLDDSGSMCAAMIKAERAGADANIRPLIDNYIDYISKKQFRLDDGTLARNRPHPNSLWLDDLFMSVPALAQMGKLTGETKYFDDAVKQVKQFSQRMFNKEKGLYMHGWTQEMVTHPQYHWARANGWAIMATVELLEVLPKDHPGYNDVLEQLRSQIYGLATYQDNTGFWHQLIDRNDSYLETSATAMYTYGIARAINRGYIDKMAFSPMVLLAWNAVSTKVNDLGQVEGTCVGTGMGFDPAFYYHRPISVFAAHGYGSVLLAGSEIILMLRNHAFVTTDDAVQLNDKLRKMKIN